MLLHQSRNILHGKKKIIMLKDNWQIRKNYNSFYRRRTNIPNITVFLNLNLRKKKTVKSKLRKRTDDSSKINENRSYYM